MNILPSFKALLATMLLAMSIVTPAAAKHVYLQLSNGETIPLTDNGAGEYRANFVLPEGVTAEIIEVEEASTFYLHGDHLDTTQVITDQNQAVVWQADQRPFGEVAITTEEIEYNLRFPGQYFDVESELYYNYFRYYDPSTGRYITSDPIGLNAGLSTYGYVGGNPLGFSDPSGLLGVPNYGGGLGQIFLWEPSGKNAFSDAALMAFQWLLGIGPESRTFGPNSIQVEELLRLDDVQNARSEFLGQIRSEFCTCQDKPSGAQSFGDWSSFGALGYVNAWIDGNSTWHFVGTFEMQFGFEPSNSTISYLIKNDSTMKSFLYSPPWEVFDFLKYERSQFPFGGKVHQDFMWSEELSCN